MRARARARARVGVRVRVRVRLSVRVRFDVVVVRTESERMDGLTKLAEIDLAGRVAVLVAAGAVLAHLLQLEALAFRAVEERVERRELSDGAEIDRLLLVGGHAAFPILARHAELLADLLEWLLEDRQLLQLLLLRDRLGGGLALG